jgi:hypothetical protein
MINQKLKKTPNINPAFEEILKKELNKIWENRFNISVKNLEILRRLGNKTH